MPIKSRFVYFSGLLFLSICLGLNVPTASTPGLAASIATVTDTKSPLSERAARKLIHRTPDMNPTTPVQSLRKRDYMANEKLFDVSYNLFHFSPKIMFKANTTTLYVSSRRLAPLLNTAMAKWNQALGKTVFKMGTAKHASLPVKFGHAGQKNWDGLYTGKTIYIDKAHFDDPKYPLAYIKPALAAQMSIKQYWTGVLAHELGHTLGLDHTAYQADLMYAPTSNGNIVAKYPWQNPIQKTATGLDGTEMAKISTRDLNRAKLAEKLGYW